MTLQELKELKNCIDTHKESLLTKDLEVENILEAIEVLIDLNANQGLINTWYLIAKENIEDIQKEILLLKSIKKTNLKSYSKI